MDTRKSGSAPGAVAQAAQVSKSDPLTMGVVSCFGGWAVPPIRHRGSRKPSCHQQVGQKVKSEKKDRSISPSTSLGGEKVLAKVLIFWAAEE